MLLSYSEIDNDTNEFETFFDSSCTFLFFKKTSFTVAALTRTIPIQTGKNSGFDVNTKPKILFATTLL